MYYNRTSQGGDKLTLNLGSIAQPAETPTTANLIEVSAGNIKCLEEFEEQLDAG